MKFSLEDIEGTLAKVELENDKKSAVIEELEKMAQELQAQRENSPRVKKQLVVLHQDGVDDDFSESYNWVIQIDEEMDHNDILPLIERAKKNYIDSTRRTKKDVETLQSALRNIPRKDFSNLGLGVKTKEPVIVIKTEGKNEQN